ncbi:MAG: hypothetical protein K6357_08325 [Elusimicrobiota bacterium]
MDNSDDKNKKRSFDDILNDLNSLLDKMPEVLDSVKKTSEEKEELTDLNKDKQLVEEETKKINADTSKINNENENSDDSKKTTDDINLDDIQLFDHTIISENKDEKKVDVNQTEVKSENIEQVNNNETKEEGSDVVLQTADNSQNLEREKEKEDISVNTNEDSVGVEVKTEEKNDEKIEKDINLDINLSEGLKENKPDEIIEFSPVLEDNIKKSEETLALDIEKNDVSATMGHENSNSNINLEFSMELNKYLSLQPPPEVLPERIKSVGFIYGSDEEVFKEALKTIDEICLSSKDKPMFVKRAFVLPYSDDLNADSVLLNSKEEKVCAVVLIGELPMEKKYEIENALSHNNIYFVNFKKNNFNRSIALELIMELIVR